MNAHEYSSGLPRYFIQFCQKIDDIQTQTIENIQLVFGDKNWIKLLSRSSRIPSIMASPRWRVRHAQVGHPQAEEGISTGSMNSIITQDSCLRRVVCILRKILVAPQCDVGRVGSLSNNRLCWSRPRRTTQTVWFNTSARCV